MAAVHTCMAMLNILGHSCIAPPRHSNTPLRRTHPHVAVSFSTITLPCFGCILRISGKSRATAPSTPPLLRR